jgi:hypothetical protein
MARNRGHWILPVHKNFNGLVPVIYIQTAKSGALQRLGRTSALHHREETVP